jgi:hypothetical protein
MVAVTEGGYDLQGLAEGLRETIDALNAAPEARRSEDPIGSSSDAPRGEATLAAVLPALSAHWQL